MKFPVTAFGSIEAGIEVLEEKDLPIEIGEVEDGECVVEVTSREPDDDEFEYFGSALPTDHQVHLSAARKVAEALWDGYYFMGDPPDRYVLTETDNETQLFYFSDD